MRWHIAVWVVIGAMGCEELDPNAQEPKIEDGFDQDAQGWRIVGDAQADSIEPDFDGTGGNPGGLISATDDAVGGIWYFQAPGRYHGDNSDVYGTLLRFDLRLDEVPDSPLPDEHDVLLAGGGITLVFDTDTIPQTTWTSLEVPLEAGAGWTVDTLTGPDATQEELERVLGDTSDLQIRGEFNYGPDAGSLDNVAFGDPT